MKYTITIFLLYISLTLFGQSQTKRVLFLGNSYTQVNNLPQMVADIALSTGDTVFFDSNTPGGYTLQGHATNATSLSKIAKGTWDFVVLQEQSQYPSFPLSQVEAEVFPFATKLDSLIIAANPCTETMFYMTWGRKNGDASNCATWPPVCTYAGMDSLLNLRYRMMADSNKALVSPVGVVWKYIRQQFPQIELYQSDESHPSEAGTYAAACCFYTTLFRKDPVNITFNGALSASDAANIRTAVKLIVYDSLLQWHIGEYDPKANFSYKDSSQQYILFTNTSSNATKFYWNFGDGDTSNVKHPTHNYKQSGKYQVMLISYNCNSVDTLIKSISIGASGIYKLYNKIDFSISPNPSTTSLYINIYSGNNYSYKILNLLGQEIHSGKLNETPNLISISSLSEGTYIFQLTEKGVIIGQQKFVKVLE
jgi:hypothetical protein